jgi:hypothetical protein
MQRLRVRAVGFLVCATLAGSLLLAGCGGGGESAEVTAPEGLASVLAWDPPQTYEDSTPLDPYRELDYYEFYLRGDDSFSDDDLPVAQVAAVTNVLAPDGTVTLQTLTTEFNLQNLLPFVPPGPTCFLSIRAVGVDGLKSGFSQPVAWNPNS